MLARRYQHDAYGRSGASAPGGGNRRGPAPHRLYRVPAKALRRARIQPSDEARCLSARRGLPGDWHRCRGRHRNSHDRRRSCLQRNHRFWSLRPRGTEGPSGTSRPQDFRDKPYGLFAAESPAFHDKRRDCRGRHRPRCNLHYSHRPATGRHNGRTRRHFRCVAKRRERALGFLGMV